MTGGLDSKSPDSQLPPSLASCRVQPRCSKPFLSPKQAPSSPSCPAQPLFHECREGQEAEKPGQAVSLSESGSASGLERDTSLLGPAA